MAKKINSLDSRWAVSLQDKIAKIERLLDEVGTMMKTHAKMEPVKNGLRHVKTAKQSVSSLKAFSRLIRGVVMNTDEVRS